MSWRFACAGLARRGLNGARSLWHDMSWAFACALCLVCAELVVLGVKSGWLLQVASYVTLILLGLKGVCSKWLPESWVLISGMLDNIWVKGRGTLDMAASSARLWAGSVRIKGHSAHFEWRSLWGKRHVRLEEAESKHKHMYGMMQRVFTTTRINTIRSRTNMHTTKSRWNFYPLKPVLSFLKEEFSHKARGGQTDTRCRRAPLGECVCSYLLFDHTRWLPQPKLPPRSDLRSTTAPQADSHKYMSSEGT